MPGRVDEKEAKAKSRSKILEQSCSSNDLTWLDSVTSPNTGSELRTPHRLCGTSCSLLYVIAMRTENEDG